MHELAPGDVLWVDFGRTVGTEQRGRRPAVVVGSAAHASETGDLVIVVPCTPPSRAGCTCRQDIALAVRSWVDAPPLFER